MTSPVHIYMRCQSAYLYGEGKKLFSPKHMHVRLQSASVYAKWIGITLPMQGGSPEGGVSAPLAFQILRSKVLNAILCVASMNNYDATAMTLGGGSKTTARLHEKI